MAETVPVAWSGAASAAPVEAAVAAPDVRTQNTPPEQPQDTSVLQLPYPGWGLQRSAKLLLSLRKEQVDPAGFYGLIAADSVRQLERYTSVAGKLIVDVGGGPGYFRSAFMAAGARYYWVEPDAGEMGAAGIEVPGRVLGSALELPLRSDSVDLTFTSNVLEHVPDPWKMAGELVRITKPGGVIFLSYTSWLSPWGGHETAPWHYLGGHRAAARFERLRGHPPKNIYGKTLFPVYVADALAWARTRMDVEIIDAVPRYLPDWSKAILHIPGVRELLTWNLALILRKK
jgi:SAM-dependent methyltransferase